MKKAPLPLLDNGKIDLERVKNGILVLTFDDSRFETWLPQLDLFDSFNARATFFYSGEITALMADSMKLLRSRGHSVGLHTTSHKDAVEVTPEVYFSEYIRPQITQAGSFGVDDIRFFAYPNNRHSEEFDCFLSRYFERFRAGTGIKAPEGYRIADIDKPLIALDKLAVQKIMGGWGIGPYYSSIQENLDAALERSARENKTITFFSHAILPEAKGVHMAEAMLRATLEKAAELGMVIAGFNELPLP